MDLRYQAKIVTLAQPVGTGSAVPGIATDQDFKLYPTQSTSIPMIRSEELILLRAEAEWFTGAKAAAITDINTIRTTSGGLAASSLTTASTDDQFITELLVQRRYSLLFEGHRWVDVRRLGKLTTLPIDIPASQVLYDDLVTAFCRSVEARKDKIPWYGQGPMDLKAMVSDTTEAPMTIPLHPAAKRFWQQQGYLP